MTMAQAINLLLIEDSEDDALLVLRELRRGQFEVTWERVQTAAELRALLPSRPWDVIISDHQLPAFNAPAALEIVKQSQLDIPFIVVSGTIGERVAVDIMKAGAHDYLMKDNLVRLPEAVRREVRESQIRAERQQAAANLAKRDRYLTALVDVQQHLLTAMVNRTTYDRILGVLGPIATTDRMYVFENHVDAAGNLLTSQRAEWCAPGITTQIGNPLLQNVCYDEVVPRWREVLGKGEVIHGVVAEFPEAERFILEAQDIQVLLVIPLVANGEFFGFIGLDDCTGGKQWDSLEVDLLRSAAAAIALAHERQQATLALAHLNQELEDRVARRTAALQESEEKFRNLVENANDIIYTLSMEGVFTYVSPKWTELLGHAVSDVVHQPFAPFVHPEDVPRCFAFLQRVITDGEKQRDIEYRVRHKNGEWRWHASSGSPQRDRQGTIVSYLGIAHDITDRKEADAQLQRTNEELARATRLKDEFLANMSHELRTPLNAILGMAEGLQEGVFGPVQEPQLKALQTIEHSGFHLLELINDILDVAKIESGQIELECVPTSVLALCHSSLSFIKQQALKKRIQVQNQIPPHLPDLWGDERRLRQVLINLLNNAVKFTPEGGQVTLSVSGPYQKNAEDGENSEKRQLSYLRFSIQDTGIGIAPEHVGRLFQPFIQIDSALNRQYAGTGLGLALVKRLVELHGGEVGVSSQVDVGSCFTVDLPCLTVTRRAAPEPPAFPLEPAPSCAATAPIILLAEDNPANVGTVQSYLTAKGYRLVLANNGEEAIALTQSQQPDLILMDIQMPGVDGLQAIRTIRQELRLTTIPIIALTALAMPGDRERCLEMGANDYLTKPVKLKHLATTIQHMLDSRGAEPSSGIPYSATSPQE